jgi:hypothetical protein
MQGNGKILNAISIKKLRGGSRHGVFIYYGEVKA